MEVVALVHCNIRHRDAALTLRWRRREDDTVGCGGGHCISAVADAIKSKREVIATIFEVVFGEI